MDENKITVRIEFYIFIQKYTFFIKKNILYLKLNFLF